MLKTFILAPFTLVWLALTTLISIVDPGFAKTLLSECVAEIEDHDHQ